MSTRTRIGVNLTWVGPDAHRGAVDALASALEELAESPPDDLELVLFGLSSLRSGHPRLVEAFETHVLPLPPIRALRVGAERTWLHREVVSRDIDVLHDAGGTSAGAIEARRVLSIHDLTPIEQPRGVNPLRSAYHRRVVPRSVAAADAIVVPSPFVRDRLVDAFGAHEDQVHVVPWPLPPHGLAAPVDTLRARTGIIGQFILLPAATQAHNEQIVAVRAMQYLTARHAETTLVLMGEAGAAEAAVMGEVARLGLDHCVVRIPAPTDAVRATLFEEAVAVVYPAVYGGFGSAVLEAMACGVPVVVADAGAAVDLARRVGAIIPAGDDAQLAVELHRILDDPEWRRRMVADGLEKARAHTPARTAEGLLAAYRSVLVGL